MVICLARRYMLFLNKTIKLLFLTLFNELVFLKLLGSADKIVNHSFI